MALLAATPAFATDGYFLNGVGAKAKGMGGVAIALPQDALSIVSNPAAGTFIGHRLDGGVEIFVPDRGAGIRGNAAGPDARFGGNGSNPFVLPEIGYVRPLSDRFAVGIAISGNGGMNTNYKANPFARFGATGPAGVNLQQLFVSPTLSARIAPGHGIGIAPVIAVQSFRANGLQPFAAASADPQHFTDRGTSWSAGVGVRVGYLGQLTDWLSVGAFYQSKIATGRFGRYAGLFEDRGSFDIPASYGAGLAVKPVPALTIAADYKRIDYAGVGAVGNPLAPLFRGVPFGRRAAPASAGATSTSSRSAPASPPVRAGSCARAMAIRTIPCRRRRRSSTSSRPASCRTMSRSARPIRRARASRSPVSRCMPRNGGSRVAVRSPRLSVAARPISI